MSDEARREDRDGITTVTFTRDHKLNAVTPEMFEVLEEAIHDLADRETALFASADYRAKVEAFAARSATPKA